MKQSKPFIVVIDFGSQYTHLITRNLKELGVDFKLLSPTASTAKFEKAAGIILSGGPRSVLKNPAVFNPNLLKINIPILGICYGLQLLTHNFGGELKAGQIREYGYAKLQIKNNHPLLADIPKTSTVWMSHGDSVIKLPKNFITLTSTQTLTQAAIAHTTKPIFGLQFHPEVDHTEYGKQILKNFIYNICHLESTKQNSVLTRITNQIKKQVDNKKVFLLVSGGVDSTVAFALLNKILGTTQVYGLHIDTGLMRLNESKNAKSALAQAGFKNLHIANYSKIFLKRLKNISDPETKRKIIGQTFLDVKNLAQTKLKLNTKDWLLGQGTIYPDTIESGGTKHSDIIKTHHNRIDILAKLSSQGKLVEPLKELYKDEVRAIGEELGLPHELLWTHPFPGPGLGVRILCNDANTNHSTFAIHPSYPLRRSSQATVDKQLITGDIKVKNYQTRILPIKSVGVQGDERSYAHPLAIGAPYRAARVLHQAATPLINQHKIINRVILKLSGPNLNLGKLQKTFINTVRLKTLQQADAIVIHELKSANLYYKIWQCPVVLLPFGTTKQPDSLVIRPIVSREAMTGQAFLLPELVIKKIINKLKRLPKISYIFYDLTNKPPGTIEWE